MSSNDREELVSIVDEEADRLNHLVSQAVEMARIEAREVQMHMESLDMRDVATDAQENCAWVAESHSLKIDIAAMPKVLGDRELIGKVLCNLLENAAKYSPPLTPIFVTAETKGDSLAVSVADRGIGIDPSEQSLVFDRLYRSTTDRKQTGDGHGIGDLSRHYRSAPGDTQCRQSNEPWLGFTFTLPLS